MITRPETRKLSVDNMNVQPGRGCFQGYHGPQATTPEKQTRQNDPKFGIKVTLTVQQWSWMLSCLVPRLQILCSPFLPSTPSFLPRPTMSVVAPLDGPR